MVSTMKYIQNGHITSSFYLTYTTKKPNVNVCVFMAVLPGHSWYIQDIKSKKYVSLATCNHDLVGLIFEMESVHTFVYENLEETSGNPCGLCSTLINGNR